MSRIGLFIVAIASLTAPAHATAADTSTLDPGATVDFQKIALREAQQAGIRRPGLFVRQLAAESMFEPCIESPAGAIGIAQIMPATAAGWRVDPYDPVPAIRSAAENMATYERQYGSYALALAAYNAGPGAVARYGGVPPYSETRHYVRKILRTGTELAGLNDKHVLPSGFTPGFDRRLTALQQDVADRGGRLLVNSGWRSWAAQQRAWNEAKREQGGFARARAHLTPPACSPHVHGVAATMAGDLRLARTLAPRHGLEFDGRSVVVW